MALQLRIISDHRRLLGEHSNIVLDKRNATLGRAQDNDWSLPDPQRFISAHHARIHYQDGTYILEDISTNGVFINGEKSRLAKRGAHILRNGDLIRLGDYRIVAILEGESSPAADRLPAPAPEIAALATTRVIPVAEMISIVRPAALAGPPKRPEVPVYSPPLVASSVNTAPDTSGFDPGQTVPAAGVWPVEAIIVPAPQRIAPLPRRTASPPQRTAPATAPAAATVATASGQTLPVAGVWPVEAIVVPARPHTVPIPPVPIIDLSADANSATATHPVPNTRPPNAEEPAITTESQDNLLSDALLSIEIYTQPPVVAVVRSAAPTDLPEIAPLLNIEDLLSTEPEPPPQVESPQAALPQIAPPQVESPQVSSPKVTSLQPDPPRVSLPIFDFSTPNPNPEPAPSPRIEAASVPGMTDTGPESGPSSGSGPARSDSSSIDIHKTEDESKSLTRKAPRSRNATDLLQERLTQTQSPNQPQSSNQSSNLSSGLVAFCKGAGIDPTALPPETHNALLHLAGLLCRESLLGLKDIDSVRRGTATRLGIDLSDEVPPNNMTSDTYPSLQRMSVEDVLTQVFSQHQSHKLDAVRWLRENLDAIRTHDQALLQAMQLAFTQFIARLDPTQLEARFQRGLRTPQADQTQYWMLFSQFYRGICEMPSGRLPHMFVEAFTTAYREIRARKHRLL